MQFFKRVIDFFIHRKLRVHIINYFLAIFITSFAVIGFFYYKKNASTMLTISKNTMQRLGRVVELKIRDMFGEIELIDELSKGFITDSKDVSLNNKPLVNYMFGVLKNTSNLSAFYVGTPEGNFLEIIDLSVEKIKTVRTNPDQHLPKGIRYAMRYIERTANPPKESWYYFDQDYKLLLTDPIAHITYDPRDRPWYKGAIETEKLYWTNFYIYNESQEAGVSCAVPVYDHKGSLLAVISADVSFATFSQFLNQVRMGKEGRIFLLDEDGTIMVPKKTDIDQQIPTEKEALKTIYSILSKEKGETRIYAGEQERVDYLAFIGSLEKTLGKKWQIFMVMPLTQVYEDVIATQKLVAIVAGVILVVAIILVFFSARRISRPIVSLAKEIDHLTHFDLDSEKRIQSYIYEISLMERSIAALRSALRSFGKYVPRLVVKELVKQGRDISVGGERRDVTIMFTDIANFTTFTEETDDAKLTPHLTAYFDTVSKIVLETGGTIDKFIGDSVMAFWNAPHDVEDAEYLACLTALRIQKELEKFNLAAKQQDLPCFYTRIGIHCGNVFVGNIGTSRRLNYTVIGDAVNTASRLEPINKNYHTNVMISDSVYQKIKDRVAARPLDLIEVKGKKQKILIYELMAIKGADSDLEPTESQQELCTAFADAYHASTKEEALAKYQAIAQKFPRDYPTEKHLADLHSN